MACRVRSENKELKIDELVVALPASQTNGARWSSARGEPGNKGERAKYWRSRKWRKTRKISWMKMEEMICQEGYRKKIVRSKLLPSSIM